MHERTAVCPRSLALILAGWFLVALFVGETQVLSIVPPQAIPAMVLSLSTALLICYSLWPAFRACIQRIPVRLLLVLHLTRFVGFYFLHLHQKGQLPGTFAIQAGWGDIIVATGALVLLCLPVLSRYTAAVLFWNTVGLLDILWVVANAARTVFTDAPSMAPFMKLPLSFLPTFLVPLIISSHVVIFHRSAQMFSAGRRQSILDQTLVTSESPLETPANRPTPAR